MVLATSALSPWCTPIPMGGAPPCTIHHANLLACWPGKLLGPRPIRRHRRQRSSAAHSVFIIPSSVLRVSPSSIVPPHRPSRTVPPPGSSSVAASLQSPRVPHRCLPPPGTVHVRLLLVLLRRATNVRYSSCLQPNRKFRCCSCSIFVCVRNTSVARSERKGGNSDPKSSVALRCQNSTQTQP